MEQTFELKITGRESHTLQGQLRSGQEIIPFRSEMELLLTLDRLLSKSWTDRACKPEDLMPERGPDRWKPI